MSLASALNIAQSALSNTSRQTSVVSRNISEVDNPNYARRTAQTVSMAHGARIVTVDRAVNGALMRESISALSAYRAQETLVQGLDRLNTMVNGVDGGSSPAILIGRLQESLQTLSSAPGNATVAASTVESARDLVRALNDGAQAVQTARKDADAQIATGVERLNGLLEDFAKANIDVVVATRTGRDTADALDRRDALVRQIAEYLPVSTATRGDNDMVLTTADGVMLFETVPRKVEFAPTANFAAGTQGSRIHVDGVPLNAGRGASTTASGEFAALLQMRDEIAPTMQSQLDEIARGLITVFAETDPSGGAADRTGLFTWQGEPGLPGADLVDGLAGRIAISADYDPARGGDALRLRDGGASGSPYDANTGNEAAFTGNIMRLLDGIDEGFAFDPAAGVEGATSLSDFSTRSIAWLEANRMQAGRSVETKGALMMRTAETLSNQTGVDLNNELARLLELEQSYAASAKLLQIANEMLATLMASVR